MNTRHQPEPFRSLGIKPDQTIVVMAPHPDDFDAIAITLKGLFEQGNKISLGVLTSGASGVEDSFCSTPSHENKNSIREAEQLESCKLFGLDNKHITFVRLDEDESGAPLENMYNQLRINAYLAARKPDFIFMPHGNDTNSGHQRCQRMIEKARKELYFKTRLVLNRDIKTVSMEPHFYTGFNQLEAEWKAKLLLCHKSQHQRNMNTRNYGFDDRILEFNRQSAQDVNIPFEFAELFEHRV